MHGCRVAHALMYIASATLLHVGDIVRPVDSMQVGYHAPMSAYSSSIGSGVVIVANKYRQLSEDAIVFFKQNPRDSSEKLSLTLETR